jgi:hypothetical protein
VLRWVAIAWLLAGCDIIFRLDDLESSPSGDGSMPGEAAVDAPANCLQDTFDGTVTRQHWERFNELMAFTISQNEQFMIEIPVSYDDNAEAGVRSINHYDLTGSFMQVEVVEATTGTTYNTETYLTARVDPGSSYLIRVSSGLLQCWSRTNYSIDKECDRTYDPAAHRWWKIEHVTDMPAMRYWTSADGARWDLQGTGPVPNPVTRLEVSLRVGNLTGGDQSPGRTIFDNFTLCPAVPVN